ncbi:MAG TPA: glycosyltransferase family 1 protein [Caldimonas sp.]|nr:glycosyltransferase family 1 protein [Caldimonas sp.]
MRIALISEHASPLARLGGVDAGGQNVYVDKVARMMARRGHRVDVATRRDDPALPPIVELDAGVRVIHVDAGPARFVAKEAMLEHMPEFGAELMRGMRGRRGYDVVHANFFMSGLVALALKRRFGIPMVMTFHALGEVRRRHQGAADGFPAERAAIERRIVAIADRVIAECPQDEADLVGLYGADPERIATVPCGVDLDEFAPADQGAARRALGLDEREFIVLQLGRMVPRKGVDNVIEAVARLARRSAARLVVVGGEAAPTGRGTCAEMRRLVDLADKCGIADRVTFAGHRQRDELAAYYAACDVFVTTPWYEPFGITPLEAMASARPVVGSAVGGIQHSVVDGVTGFLVAPRDPAALADRLDHLQSDPALARAMGRAGARRVRANFTWSRVAEELEAVYECVLAESGAAASRHSSYRDLGARGSARARRAA